MGCYTHKRSTLSAGCIFVNDSRGTVVIACDKEKDVVFKRFIGVHMNHVELFHLECAYKYAFRDNLVKCNVTSG